MPKKSGVRVDVYKALIEVIVKMKKKSGGGPIRYWELVEGGGGSKVGGSG